MSLEHITSLLTHLSIFKILKSNKIENQSTLAYNTLIWTVLIVSGIIKIFLRSSLSALQCFQWGYEGETPEKAGIPKWTVYCKEKNRLPVLLLFGWVQDKRIMCSPDSSPGRMFWAFLIIDKTCASSLENVAFLLEFNIFKNYDLLERINHIWKRF